MNGIKPYFLKLTLAVALIIGSTTACSTEEETSIPYVQISKRYSLTIYNGLTVPGVTYFSEIGYGGVYVYYNGSYYLACDGACPYEADANIIVEEEGGVATCPECGSKYNLIDGGSLMSGPSSESLRVYNVYVSGNYLYITN
jgi:nitrite reductase/ring-hydroxylating ferredoxin subunit